MDEANFWVVKWRRNINEPPEELFQINRLEQWYTARPPKQAREGDRLFFWEGSPGSRLTALGEFVRNTGSRDAHGNTILEFRNLTAPLKSQITQERLRQDPVFEGASFLKAAASQLMYKLTNEQGLHLYRLLLDGQPEVQDVWHLGSSNTQAKLEQDTTVASQQTGEGSTSGFHGEKLYQKRAQAALPILVRQAKANQTITYGELTRELDIINHNTLNYVLGAIGNWILELGLRWNETMPAIQAIVVNKDTGLPGEGFGGFAPDPKEFKRATLRERKQIVDTMLREVYRYKKWDEVLKASGLQPTPAPFEAFPMDDRQYSRRGSGEGEAHQKLKEAVAVHPEWLGLPRAFAPGQTEVVLRSGDRVDVVFANARQRIAVEVKAVDAPEQDLIRGIFQCVKYAAVLEAEASANQVQIDCRAILALGGALPKNLHPLRATLGVDVHENVGLKT
jgi:predicted secreted protein